MATDTFSPPAALVPERRADDVLSRLADRVGARLISSTIFGTAVERDGVTVVPVAAVRFGFGGGGGLDASGERGEGGGAVGAGTATGYIELKDGHSRFVPIVHPVSMGALVVATALGVLLILRRAAESVART